MKIYIGRLSTTLILLLSSFACLVLSGCGGGGAGSSSQTTPNGVPTITGLSPSSAAAGAPAQTLTINGTNFLSSSTATYNSVAHSPTFVSSTQLTISLSASDQAAAGSYPVVVTNPSPGGGSSQAGNFTVTAATNPVPTITGLSPSSVAAGAAAQTLAVNGTNFLSTSTVTYNNVVHTATFVSSTQLTISLGASDQATAGSYPVVVTNPSPGGGASQAVNFTVTTSNEVQINSLSETTANPFDSLTITGTGFSQGTLAISILFIPENGDPSIMIPVSASASDSVQVMVPIFTGVASGTFTAETVDVQVVQFSASTTYLSNRITGLQVSAPPSVPSSVPVGAMTAALLYSALNISGAAQTSENGNSIFSNTAATLTQFTIDVAPLIAAVNAITNDPTETVNLTTANGTITPLTAQTLALTDQLAQALIAAIVNQGSIPTSSSSNCPTATGNATYDSSLCSMQSYFQTLASQVSATSASRRSEDSTRPQLTPPESAVLTIYANLIAYGIGEAIFPAGGGPVLSLIVSPIVTTVAVSLAVNHDTPPGAEIAQGVGLNFLDQA